MPRTLKRVDALACMDDALQSPICAYLLVSTEDYRDAEEDEDYKDAEEDKDYVEDDEDEEYIQDLLNIQHTIPALQYLDTLEDYIHVILH